MRPGISDKKDRLVGSGSGTETSCITSCGIRGMGAAMKVFSSGGPLKRLGERVGLGESLVSDMTSMSSPSGWWLLPCEVLHHLFLLFIEHSPALHRQLWLWPGNSLLSKMSWTSQRLPYSSPASKRLLEKQKTCSRHPPREIFLGARVPPSQLSLMSKTT